MREPVCLLVAVALIISSIPIIFPMAGAQTSPLRTVWENPCTLTTYQPNSEVNSTFYTFPKVIWNGSQYVDYVFNQSDMSAGIGSVYLKVCPDHTIFYDPYQKEETIKSETWIVEEYNSSSSTWQTDSPVGDDVHSLVNSSGIHFDRTTMLCSGTALDEWYWLRIGSQLKISLNFHPAQDGQYRLVWTLNKVSATQARWLGATDNVTTQIVNNTSCSWVHFANDNASRCLGLDTTPQARIDVRPGQLVSAISSADGDVTAKLLYADKTCAELFPTENIQLAFNLPEQTMQTRTFIIISKGHYYTITP